MRGPCRRFIGNNKAKHRKYKRLKFGGGQAYGRSMTKPPLQHKIRKLGMICSVKPVLTEDLRVVQMEDFSITCYMCEIKA
jgi:hypothetical protein